MSSWLTFCRKTATRLRWSRASTTASSPRPTRLPTSFCYRTDWAARSTMPALPSRCRITTPRTRHDPSAYWAAQRTTRWRPGHFGSTSTAARASLMWTPLLRLNRFWHFVEQPVSRAPFSLAAVWASTSIGRWTKTWTVRRGRIWHWPSRHCVSVTVCKLGPSELRIFRRSFGHRALIGAR